MTGALFFLVWNSWLNRTKMRIRRLKQPKYLIGAIFGGLYILYIFGLRIVWMFAHHGHGGNQAITAESEFTFESIGALVLFAMILLAWLIPRDRAALTFSEAEVAFLFPAPVSRRTLIHFKLLKSQIAIFFWVLFLMIIFGRFWAGPMALTRAVGWWVILTTLNLHILVASFAREKLFEHGISTWKRRVAILTLVGAAAGAVYVWAKQTVPPPDLNHLKKATDLEYYFQQVTQAGPLPYLLYPFRIVVRPYIEGWVGTPGSFFLALLPAVLLMAAHYWWVMRADVAFEEASIEKSKKFAEAVATIRANRGQWVTKPKKKKRPPFKLGPIGPAATGLLWKNLIGAGSMFTWRFWILMGCMLVPIGTAFASGPNQGKVALLGMMSGLLFLMSCFIGPQMLRQDFRQDLTMVDVLKTYPLRGWQVALGELLAPAVMLTGFQWLLLIFGASLMSHWQEQEIPLDGRVAVALGAALIMPGLNVVSLLIPNASVLIFPGWFQAGKDAPQGIEAMGQRILFMFGSIIVFMIAIVAPLVLFVSIYFLAQLVMGPVWPVPVASLGAGVILAGEACLGLWWLGRLFDKFDVAGDA